MKEHTPGPWTTCVLDKCRILAWQHGPIAYCFCPNETTTDIKDWDEAHANARLIAAAPELLEACQRFINEYRLVFQEDYQGSPLEYIYNLAVKAIDKATKE